MLTDPATIKKIKGEELEVALEKKLSSIKSKSDEDKYAQFAQQHNLPFNNLKTAPIDSEALAILDEGAARAAKMAVIIKGTGNKKIVVAILDPNNEATKSGLEMLKEKGYEATIIITSPEALENVFKKYAGFKKEVAYEIGAVQISEQKLDKLYSQIKNISDIKSLIKDDSTTELLETFIAGALKVTASDIHLEPESENTRLRYRLDGILNDIAEFDNNSYVKLLNRVKVLSKMKLNIHKAAQDGRFTIKQKAVNIEVRVSVLPSEYGESIVMRLLDPRAIKTSLADLGMRPDLLELLKSQLARSTGAILTTGPTGSGKTTTLYAFIRHLNNPGTKIVTIEDPIEYHIQGASQTQVDPAKSYTFANGLRAIVRQDPDIILVGEIRDKETAEIALHAALTGHLVLSTIHTNNAAGTIPRLIDLGIQPQIIAPAINVAMGQRLVRRLCEKCKKKVKASAEIAKRLKTNLELVKDGFKLKLDSLEVYEPGKCAECNNSGYTGRIGVYEAFIISKTIEKLILTSPAISDVEELAIKEGMVTMLQDGYLKVLDGITSVEEVERIIS